MIGTEKPGMRAWLFRMLPRLEEALRGSYRFVPPFCFGMIDVETRNRTFVMFVLRSAKDGSVKGMAELAREDKKGLAAIAPIAKKHFERAEMGRQAAELAYYVLLAIFPVLLALGNIIPLLPIPQDQVMSYVEMAVPPEVGNVLLPILEGYLNSGSGGVISFSLLFTLWPASKAFNVFQTVLNQVYDAEKRKNFIVTRIFSFLTAMLLVLLVGVMAFLFVFGQQILALVQGLINVDLSGVFAAFQIFRWVVAGIVLILIMAFVYYFVPNVKWPFRYALPGAVLATVGFLLVSQLFSLYINLVGGASIGSGTIGIFIVLMIWLYLIGIVLILGGVLNVIYYDYKHEDAIVIDEGKTYLSVLYSPKAKYYVAKKQILRKNLRKENRKIKSSNLAGQVDAEELLNK